ncbi:hypothetical protein HHK36_027780 [Tetracentron sinense]|uniref:AB hydrolase-1 domain-containing protein n=1 Tax=Tetracentron sinense TaxID=13715 RepID=A0A834YEK3_TETSI|nr:hypothetical protein HHK36_027780 [Tetracentron sinense]
MLTMASFASWFYTLTLPFYFLWLAVVAGHLGKLATLTLTIIVFSSWFYILIQPPKPDICGTPGGPPITAKRIRLRDGRSLSYFETGVSKDIAKFKIVLAHGFTGSRMDTLRTTTEIIEELGVYMVGYDRAGHGESDPNPRSSLRSEAYDLEELADALDLGPTFHVVGSSLGGYAVWACLKYIPTRLAGAAMLAPVINYRWPGFPNNLSKEAYYQQGKGDQWALRVAYYVPWLLNWWLNQSWLPSPTVIKGTTFLPNRLDSQFRDQAMSTGIFHKRMNLSILQGVHESLHRDLMVMFGKWEFDPMDLPPPSIPVHLWHGYEDGIVPVTLQRYICHRLNWIKYHELPSGRHFLSAIPGFDGNVLKTLLLQSCA